MCGGVLQPHGRRQCGADRGGGDFQVPEKDVGPVRQQLEGGPLEFQEGLSGLEPAGEAAAEEGGGATSVRQLLSSGGTGSLTFGGRDLGFVGGNVPESGWGTRWITKSDNGTKGIVIEGRNLAVCGSREGP